MNKLRGLWGTGRNKSRLLGDKLLSNIALLLVMENIYIYSVRFFVFCCFFYALMDCILWR